MATLAYPVSQSTTNTLFGPTIGSGLDNLKPTGKSFNSITNINWGWVLEANKLNGNSVRPTTFVKIQIPLDTKKLSLMEFNSSWAQANTAKLGVSRWYPNNITGFFNSSANNQIATFKVTSWLPTILSFENAAIAPMQTGNVYAGSLVTPYLYETFTTGSMILVNNTTIGIGTSSVPTIYSYTDGVVTIKTGSVSAYGELQRNNGWTN
jgi:hypothetical protein